jgi:catechol 2,3-dioxygenase-like lactoylglutathione lyase family enzyme
MEGVQHMIKGTYHIGFGVSNDVKTIAFYQKHLNFGKVRISIEDVSEGNFGDFVGAESKYRWSMLTHNVCDVDFEPVQLLSRKPIHISRQWGDIGFNDVCFKVEGLQKLYDQLQEEHVTMICSPHKMSAGSGNWEKQFFLFQDPDGISVKFEEEVKNATIQPKVLGYDYMSIGVSDLEQSLNFYRVLGYNRLLWDLKGHLNWMDEACGHKIEGRTVMIGSDFDDHLLQLIQIPNAKNSLKRRTWGDIGLLEFCLRVHNLDSICSYLRKKNVKILVEPTLATPKLDYAFIAYVADPDGNYVELSYHKKQ